MVAEAAEEAQMMTAIASAIEHLPVEDGQLDLVQQSGSWLQEKWRLKVLRPLLK